ATVLNISPDHMDRYADVPAYQQAKQRVYLNAGAAIVNRQDPLTFVPEDYNVATVISFGLDEPSANNYGVRWQNGAAWLARGDELLMPVSDMAMLGAHNVANALAALAMGEVAGFTLPAMLATLRTFAGLEHRCEKVAIANEVVWVNDSKGTNVGATLAAIEGLATSIAGKWVIILGGIGKNADFTPLSAPIAKCCKAAILIGEDAPKLWDLLHDVIPSFMARDLSEVVQIALQQTTSGDGVLLSPACASLDMFENYKQRGAVFKQHVLQEIGSSYATAASTT
ncbi:MAG TPA: UDP-N-acetylmuramoyl-L-alanine--D-glutamate ligase, partial [Gammaproteobacteria bacterium]|nr:UDP-N-acetylmuramoyl-L-alanine--D-glutamate ligase [Gammaproteobacteria bacterium]